MLRLLVFIIWFCATDFTLHLYNKWVFRFGSMIGSYRHLRIKSTFQVRKEGVAEEGSACSRDRFSCSIRKLSGCCLKTGWSAKHRAVTALNVSSLILSSPTAAPHCDFAMDCSQVVSFFFFSCNCDGPEESCFNPGSWKCLIGVSRPQKISNLVALLMLGRHVGIVNLIVSLSCRCCFLQSSGDTRKSGKHHNGKKDTTAV